MTNNVMSEQDLETAVSACIESILWTGYYILEAETEPILLNPDYTVGILVRLQFPTIWARLIS